ncbi:hypothetical protein [Streptomyces radicis]|uniref:Secreted protein n=1 Tax=Streptomyces radicis TaxID=1750517 RepID=A0A3A9W6L7_9ACTN|nr:hypothetical protein [Streptomyces radicis]RKN08053.1 hypothetical protein D7319_16135 [Streptomyces radicis]RKN20408.1 hypothetical protein D7318_17995 [Streptomyces radicis]
MRRSIRLALPAVAAVTLLVGACSSDDGDEETTTEGQSEEQGGAGEEEGDEGGATGGEDDAAGGGDPEGNWLTSAGNALSVFAGQVAYMEAASGAVCSGTIEGDALALTCEPADAAWTEGTVAVEGDQLNVTWGDGTEESFERLTDGLPDMPEIPELPDMPEIPEVPEIPDL